MVIYNLKCYYKKALMARKLWAIDSKEEFPRVTILNAPYLLKTARGRVQSAMIENCFRKVGFMREEQAPELS